MTKTFIIGIRLWLVESWSNFILAQIQRVKRSQDAKPKCSEEAKTKEITEVVALERLVFEVAEQHCLRFKA